MVLFGLIPNPASAGELPLSWLLVCCTFDAASEAPVRCYFSVIVNGDYAVALKNNGV